VLKNQAVADLKIYFLPCSFGARLHRLFSVSSSVTCVAARGVSVVCRLFVISSRMVLCSFLVMTSGMRMMF
jgi:hypothetical protein